MGAPEGVDVIVLEDVLVERRTDLGWHCEIQGRRMFVANLQVAPGWNVPAAGQRGPIGLTRIAFDDVKASLPQAALQRTGTSD